MPGNGKSSPTIGITCGPGPTLPRHAELYIKAVEKAGGLSIFLTSDSTLPGAAVEIDGFIIPGGRDIDPKIYGETPSSSLVPEDPGRAGFEFLLLREIMRYNKPLLGVCYGMQLMNVFCGGTLYQDISFSRKPSIDHLKGNHSVSMADNPYFPRGIYEVNSSHHQAVKDPGTGIRPFAFSSDGLIEAFYHGSYPFFLGVQWHPERMNSPLTVQIFKVFIEVCNAVK